jgi:hypothetical protein
LGAAVEKKGRKISRPAQSRLETQRRREEGEGKREEDLTPARGLARGHRVHREGEEKASILFALRGRKKDRGLHREAR